MRHVKCHKCYQCTSSTNKDMFIIICGKNISLYPEFMNLYIPVARFRYETSVTSSTNFTH